MLHDGAVRSARIIPTLPSLSVVLGEQERKTRLAYWIRDMRFRRGLTPPGLADLVGVSRSTVNKWESGEQVPSMIWLGLLANALRVDPRLFADLPPIPPSGAAEYLVHEAQAAAASAVEEGLRRARQPRVERVPEQDPPSPERPSRGNGAKRGSRPGQ
jgi:transcriptional regulator with XRE-family HTH domain